MMVSSQRTISKEIKATSNPYPKSAGTVHLADPAALKQHLHAVAIDINARWILVHADDGICWGRISGGTIAFPVDEEQSSHPYSAAIRPSTLQECRVFGGDAEYYMWRTDTNTFADRIIEDKSASVTEQENPSPTLWTATIDEDYWLWGRYAEGVSDHFTLLHEGRQGLEHVVPWPLASDDLRKDQDNDKTQPRPLCLRVRHYLNRFDASKPDTADAFIEMSRLVSLHHPEQKS